MIAKKSGAPTATAVPCVRIKFGEGTTIGREPGCIPRDALRGIQHDVHSRMTHFYVNRTLGTWHFTHLPLDLDLLNVHSQDNSSEPIPKRETFSIQLLRSIGSCNLTHDALERMPVMSGPQPTPHVAPRYPIFALHAAGQKLEAPTKKRPKSL